MTEHMKFYAFEQTETERPRKISSTSDLKRLISYNFQWKTLFYAVIGFLLGGASFMDSVFPCGIGWLGAMAVWDKRRVPFQILPVILGTVLWTETPIVYAAILLLLMIFFGVYTPPAKKVRYLLPLTVFSVTLAVHGIFLAFSGITDLLLIVTFVESIVAAGLSLVFSATLETWQRFTTMERPTWEEILCNFLLATGIIMGMEHIVILSMPLSEIAMRLVVLLGALLGGAGGGAAAGALMGIIPSFAGTTSPSALGLFAFSGLLGGVFRRFGRFGVIVGFLSGNLVLTLYLLNTSLIVYSVVASMIAAALLFVIPDKILFRGKEMLRTDAVRVQLPNNYDSSDYISLRLRTAGKALSSLKTALAITHEKDNSQEEKNIEGILAHLSRTVCGDCSTKNICWKSDFYDTYRDIMTMFATVEARGLLYGKDAPEGFKKRCSHRKEIVASINCLYEMYKKNTFWRQQTMSGRSLAVCQLENTVNLLTKIEDNLSEYIEFRKVLDQRLTGTLRNSDFPVDYINLSDVEENHLDINIKIRNCSGGARCGRPISAAIEELTGKKFRLHDFKCSTEKGEVCQCRFFLHGGLHFDCHSLQMAKGNKSINGDSCCDFLLSDAKKCFIISDGMGSGEAAKKEAESVMCLVKDVLKSGFDESFAAAMVNYIMLTNKDEEIYATADICLMDLYKRQVEFVKLGAAPSFICSPSLGVKMVAGNSLPLGGNGEDKPKVFTEKITAGDILVMLSDGVLETGLDPEEMEFWLTKTLSESQKESSKVIAERILSGAVAFSGGEPRDDMTVTVVVIGN